MLNVFETMIQEQQNPPEYPDEVVASYLRYVSLVRNLRSMDSTSIEYIKGNKLDEAQMWLIRHSESVADIAVMNFDRIKEYINPDLPSCDALFYWFDGSSLSYLVEFKKTDKKNLFKFLNIDKNDKDQIIIKIKTSKALLCDDINFAGGINHEELIKNTHCVIIYDGKNDMPTSGRISKRLPRGGSVSHDGNRRQNKASKQSYREESNKEPQEVIDFANEVESLGFSAVNKNQFPGDALPKLKKINGDRIRKATIMAAQDFAEVIEAGFFDNWNWGDYAQFWAFVPENVH